VPNFLSMKLFVKSTHFEFCTNVEKYLLKRVFTRQCLYWTFIPIFYKPNFHIVKYKNIRMKKYLSFKFSLYNHTCSNVLTWEINKNKKIKQHKNNTFWIIKMFSKWYFPCNHRAIFRLYPTLLFYKTLAISLITIPS